MILILMPGFQRIQMKHSRHHDPWLQMDSVRVSTAVWLCGAGSMQPGPQTLPRTLWQQNLVLGAGLWSSLSCVRKTPCLYASVKRNAQLARTTSEDTSPGTFARLGPSPRSPQGLPAAAWGEGRPLPDPGLAVPPPVPSLPAIPWEVRP